MYEPVVEAGGGKDHLIAQSKMLANIGSLKLVETFKPYTYVSGTQNDYVIVSTHANVVVGGRHFDYRSYELGIKPRSGGKWEYLDGTGITPQARSVFLSDLPADTSLPTVQKKEIEENTSPAATAPSHLPD